MNGRHEELELDLEFGCVELELKIESRGLAKAEFLFALCAEGGGRGGGDCPIGNVK